MRSINFDKVIVEWMDINSCDDAWNTEDHLKDLTKKILQVVLTNAGIEYKTSEKES